MYGKIFESIYDGTLACDWRALVTFQQFIILSDVDGSVDMTPEAISRRTGIPIEHITAGIEILEKTDRYSRTPDEGGRRIELIDEHRPWGWHIVNYEKYKKLHSYEAVKEQTRRRVKRHRESRKKQECNVTVTQGNEKKRHIDIDVTIPVDIPKKKKPPKKSKITFLVEDYEAAQNIYHAILMLNPNHKEPNFNSWANTIRLMRECDKKPLTEVLLLFKWANNHHFWKANILCPDTLRKQWDKLTIQKNQERDNEKDQRSRSKRFNDTIDEIAKAAAERGETI